jgi:hypothetical protein
MNSVHTFPPDFSKDLIYPIYTYVFWLRHSAGLRAEWSEVRVPRGGGN